MSTPGGVDLMMLASTAGGAGYELEKSLRFNPGDTASLNHRPNITSNKKTWTWSGWVKLGQIKTWRGIFSSGNATTNPGTNIYLNANDQLIYTSYNSGLQGFLQSTAVFRDPAAWYHIVCAVDTTLSTANNRQRLYVNGVELVDFNSRTNHGINDDTYVNNNDFPTAIGLSGQIGSAWDKYFDGYISEVHFVDGQALDPSYFGIADSAGIWQPKSFAPLASPNNGTVWSTNVSGTPFSYQYVWRQAFDGSYTTGVAGGVASANEYNVTFSGISFSTGVTVYANSNTANFWLNGTEVFMTSADSWGGTTYRKTFTSSDIGSSTLTQIGVDDGLTIYAIEVDGVILVDGNTANMGVNGYHLPLTDSSSVQALGSDTSITLPDTPANRGMDVIRYIGNGGTQVIRGLHFSPDLVWIKNRDAANSTRVYDTLRGPFNELYTQSTSLTYVETNGLGGFTQDGFSIGSAGQINANGNEFVAWCWRGGETSAVNNDGSIESTVSVNQQYGFSVITYAGNSTAGATIGHGLGAAPSFIITKPYSGPSNNGWQVGHTSIGWTKRMYLQTTDGELTTSGAWNDTAPDSSVFTAGVSDLVNETGYNYVAYCWAEKAGFSKFGSYTGNGNAIGPVVTTGFKPKWLLIKQSNTSGEAWMVFDSERNGTNPKTQILTLSAPDASEASLAIVDFLDDGFQLVNNTGAASNATGATYIYAAFAEQPSNDYAVNNMVASTATTGFTQLLYEGNGSTQAITGVGFAPDLVWLKSRGVTLRNHSLNDTVRGASLTLSSNTTDTELSRASVTAFGTDGFTLGSYTETNTTSDELIAYCWKAGDSNVTNTDGTITSTVRANPTYGFSIVTYTGTGSPGTVGHGLGAKPGMILLKDLDNTRDWSGWLLGGGSTAGYLNLTDLFANTNNAWLNFGSTQPNSLTFSVANQADDAFNFVAYCWTSVPGISAFGSYSGNGTSSGPIVQTGFKPAFVMVKRTNGSGSWVILDSVRTPVNPRNISLYADTSDGDYTPGQDWADFLDNGFQPTATYGEINALGGTYAYAAFAGTPPGVDVDSVYESITTFSDQTDTGVGAEISGNYCVWNPLVGRLTHESTFSNGNLRITYSDPAVYQYVAGTLALTSGKWYYECVCENFAGTSELQFGVSKNTIYQSTADLSSVKRNYLYTGSKISTGAPVAYGAAFTSGDVIGVAIDLDAGTLVFYKNGVSQGTAFTDLLTALPDGGWVPYSVGFNVSFSANFGQQPFIYDAPTDFKAICTANVAEPTISDGSTNFDVVTYDGTGVQQSLTFPGAGFQPDFVWVKNRTSSGQYHVLTDTVRGIGVNGSYAEINSNDPINERDFPQRILSYDTNGFTVGTDGTGGVNTNTFTYVGWGWKGGGTAVANGDGTIASSVSTNRSAGISIVGYEGTGTAGTVGHNLNVEPQIIIIKNRSSSNNWAVWSTHLSGNDYYLFFNNPDAQSNTFYTYWNNTAPTSSVFSVGTNTAGSAVNVNESGSNHIAYCFTPVAGYSKFGNYIGNGATGYPNAEGPFVHCGFRPRYIVFKCISQSENWTIYDTERATYNYIDNKLLVNNSGTETTNANHEVDVLSNGFKIRNNNGEFNQSAGVYIYMAFAENPFTIARAR